MEEWETRYRNIFHSDENGNLLQLSDAKIHTDDGCKFDIHRVILAKGNSYFRAMFCGFGKDNKIFVIPGISGECLSEILVYIYTDNINLTNKNVADLMIAADYLLMNDLMTKIKTYSVKVTVESSVPVLLSAFKLDFTDIYKAHFRFIQTHCDEVLTYHKSLISDFPIQILMHILSSKSLYNVSEAILWDVINKWVQRNELRQSYVPALVQHLAASEIDKHLAKNILNNDIVKKNPHCKNLNCSLTENGFKSYLDVLQNFIRNGSNHLVKQIEFRIPHKLYVVTKPSNTDIHFTNIYVTYDEQLDVWRKVHKVAFKPHEIITFKNKLYLLSPIESFLKIDLLDNSVVEFKHKKILGVFSAFKVRGRFYFHGYCITGVSKEIFIFDPQSDTWLHDLRSIHKNPEKVAAILDKLYVVYLRKWPRTTFAAVYDPEKRVNPWSNLPPPSASLDYYQSEFVAYHSRLFLIGKLHSKWVVEIFDPSIGKWRKGPKLPADYDNGSNALVLNESLYVFGYKNFKFYTLKYNEIENNWHKMEEHIKVNGYHFCEIDEEEAVKSLWLKNMFSTSELRKSNLNL